MRTSRKIALGLVSIPLWGVAVLVVLMAVQGLAHYVEQYGGALFGG